MEHRAGSRGLVRWLAIGMAVAALVAGCSKQEGPDEVGARRAAVEFLRNAEEIDVQGLCSSFTKDLLVRLSPPDGDCKGALTALTRLTGGGSASTLGKKRVDTVDLEGDIAIVVLKDRITGENELPLRFAYDDGTWLLDELGPGVKISQACIDERKRVEQAVDEYLSAKEVYPPDTKALVPGYLPKLPDNHEVRADGKVVDTGVCA
ncbi:MAG: hypothetical protein U0P45_10900 [Acidimicrobiales bacterium]